MLDRLQYEVFQRLWRVWHIHMRRFYGWGPNQKYMIRNRPWWHLCCNGDTGGWRTHFCDWLEWKWRKTKTYERG